MGRGPVARSGLSVAGPGWLRRAGLTKGPGDVGYIEGGQAGVWLEVLEFLMSLRSEMAGAPAPVNMAAVECFLLASGWQRNASGKLAPPALVAGGAGVGAPGQGGGLVLPTADAARGALRGGAAR